MHLGRWRFGARPLRAVAVALMAASLVTFGLAAALALKSKAAGVGTFEPLDALWALSFLPFSLIGGLIALRRPSNPVGWLLCTSTLSLLAGVMLLEYAQFGLVVAHPRLPGATAAAWLSRWVGAWMAASAVLVLLLFPDGRFRGRFWKLVGVAGVSSSAALAVAEAFRPGRIPELPIENPFAISTLGPLLADVSSVAGTAIGFVMLISIAAPFARLRRAGVIERQQIKWFASGVAALALTFLLLLVLENIFGVVDADSPWLTVLFVAGVSCVPISIGIAIVRHRLYDIDVIINRTLVYGALTASLAAVYFLIVAGLQGLLARFGEGSDLAVVASTLAVAALFRPLRGRIQTFIDHRFYRSRYDATKTLESFAARLRHEVELRTLREELLVVVHSTVQPTHASLWLREGAR